MTRADRRGFEEMPLEDLTPDNGVSNRRTHSHVWSLESPPGAGDVVLHRVVGMLTEQQPPPPAKGEAVELTSAGSLSHIKAAYRVTSDSGVPLALPGQIVLGGDTLTKDQLPEMEGTLVALSLDNGSGVLKRIGKSVPGSAGRLWQFESVGGLGRSMVVSLVEPEEHSEAPRFVAARRILGVLYAV